MVNIDKYEKVVTSKAKMFKKNMPNTSYKFKTKNMHKVNTVKCIKKSLGRLK